MYKLLIGLLALLSLAYPRQHFVQFRESFDSTAPPSLPAGWATSANRSPSGDFVLTASSPRSAPGALLSSNATISQSLTSPVISFFDRTPVRLEFYSSRSSTHTCGLLVEASVDGGVTFSVPLRDTIRNPGTSGYVLSSVSLAPLAGKNPTIQFRWRLVGTQSAGSSGTFRLDDVTITSQFSTDLALAQLSLLTRATIEHAQTVQLVAHVRNVGARPIAEFNVDFYDDENGDGLMLPMERVASIAVSLLPPLDSILVTVQDVPIKQGINRYIARVVCPQDQNALNDTVSAIWFGGTPPATLVINEIMYDPLPGQCEWIELYNRGIERLDLSGWRFSDRPTQSGVNSSLFPVMTDRLGPGGLLVVASDSSVLSHFPNVAENPARSQILILNRSSGFSLNNDGDDVVLRDPLGTTVDSVSYLPAWHHPGIPDSRGRSLERINPGLASNDRRNWSTSPDILGGTPGRANRLYTSLVPSTASLSVQPNPFSPDGDGFEDVCIVQYRLPTTAPLIRISIFDARGRLIRSLANTELGASHGEIVWDGLDDSGRKARIGLYIILLEGVESGGSTVSTAKTVVVVAAKL